MIGTKQDPWATGRTWQIVRADTDLEHVFFPQSRISFVLGKKNGIPGYRLVQDPPPGDCFRDTFLQLSGTRQPDFEQIAQVGPLPDFNASSAQQYADVSENLATHVDRNRDVQRLEGIVTLPCHASDAKSGHPALRMRTLIYVYQFNNAVGGKAPLLLVWAPLSPVCPVNGNGTVIALS